MLLCWRQCHSQQGTACRSLQYLPAQQAAPAHRPTRPPAHPPAAGPPAAAPSQALSQPRAHSRAQLQQQGAAAALRLARRQQPACLAGQPAAPSLTVPHAGRQTAGKSAGKPTHRPNYPSTCLARLTQHCLAPCTRPYPPTHPPTRLAALGHPDALQVPVAQRHLGHWVTRAGGECVVDQGGGEVGGHQPARGGVGWQGRGKGGRRGAGKASGGGKRGRQGGREAE